VLGVEVRVNGYFSNVRPVEGKERSALQKGKSLERMMLEVTAKTIEEKTSERLITIAPQPCCGSDDDS
jgi:hypothetical protein